MSGLFEKLEESILSGRAMHAYLFSGADPETTDRAARFAASLLLYGRRNEQTLKSDPDYMEYDGSVPMGDFRDRIKPEIYRETFGANGRVVVFRNASLLSRMVQNAMLKVLEEPPADTSFILTGNEYGILPTIRSRCMTVRCPVPSPEETAERLKEAGASPQDAKRFALMSGGSAARALRLYGSEDARALRDGAVSAFLAALKGAPDMKWTRAKRSRPEWLEANELMLLLCHELLMMKEGLGSGCFPDRERELKAVCANMGEKEILLVVDALCRNAEKLATNSPAGGCFDGLFARIAEIAVSASKKK